MAREQYPSTRSWILDAAPLFAVLLIAAHVLALVIFLSFFIPSNQFPFVSILKNFTVSLSDFNAGILDL